MLLRGGTLSLAKVLIATLVISSRARVCSAKNRLGSNASNVGTISHYLKKANLGVVSKLAFIAGYLLRWLCGVVNCSRLMGTPE